MLTDPISDYLTRIRNAIKAKHRILQIPCSNLKIEMSKVLKEKGYIRNYKVEKDDKQGILKIALKYHPQTKQNAITHLERISKPGLRKYAAAKDIPRVLNGLGIAIMSTSKGVITDKEAKNKHVGGEILCHVY